MQSENALLIWFGQANYWLMGWANAHWWPVIGALIFAGCLIGMTPLRVIDDHRFHEVLLVYIRKGILYVAALFLLLPFIMLYLYDMTTYKQLADSQGTFLNWFLALGKKNAYTILIWVAGGFLSRFIFLRYAVPFWSAILRRLRNQQTDEAPIDIRDESTRYKAKDYLPNKHYTKQGIFVGLDLKGLPIIIPWNVWYEKMMQIIGSTGYGKGVLQGCILDQIILKGDNLFFVDPKEDKFAAHIMYQRCKEMGRKFYYVSLRDGEFGSWGPFLGGTPEDAFVRLTSAFKIEKTGEPKTDYYRGQELRFIKPIMSRTRRIEGLYQEVMQYDESTVKAELELWREYSSLCPSKKGGFSIEKAIKENAVVYIKGSLRDPVIKTATKVFIVELMQEIERLSKSGDKKKHTTVMIDEVAFLVSKQLKEALATIRGFGANLVLAYQGPKDLELVDDVTIDGKALRHSVDQNCQIRAIYGGSDFDTAEWVANMSGTIIKEVTKMEKTDVSDTGGETWDNQRTVGALEENYITTNTIIALPERVCALLVPGRLATIAHTSFVPVKSMNSLFDFLKSKEAASHAEPALERILDSISSNEFIEDHDEISQAKPSKKAATNNANMKENTAKSDTTLLTAIEADNTHSPAGEVSLEDDLIPFDAVGAETVNVSLNDRDADEKRKAKNKARKERQKAKKQQPKEPHISVEDENNDGDTDEILVEKSEPSLSLEGFGDDDFSLDTLSLKDDSETLKYLSDDE